MVGGGDRQRVPRAPPPLSSARNSDRSRTLGARSALARPGPARPGQQPLSYSFIAELASGRVDHDRVHRLRSRRWRSRAARRPAPRPPAPESAVTARRSSTLTPRDEHRRSFLGGERTRAVAGVHLREATTDCTHPVSMPDHRAPGPLGRHALREAPGARPPSGARRRAAPKRGGQPVRQAAAGPAAGPGRCSAAPARSGPIAAPQPARGMEQGEDGPPAPLDPAAAPPPDPAAPAKPADPAAPAKPGDPAAPSAASSRTRQPRRPGPHPPDPADPAGALDPQAPSDSLDPADPAARASSVQTWAGLDELVVLAPRTGKAVTQAKVQPRQRSKLLGAIPPRLSSGAVQGSVGPPRWIRPRMANPSSSAHSW